MSLNINLQQYWAIQSKRIDNVLTFTNTGTGTLQIAFATSQTPASGKVLFYSLNKGKWTLLLCDTTSTYSNGISVPSGKSISFVGNLNTQSNNSLGTFKTNTATTYTVSGDITSLTNGYNEGPVEDFNTMTSCSFRFASLFNGCTKLTEAKDLKIRFNNTHMYYRFFKGCTSLTKIPKLSLTTMYSGCYKEMFMGCSNLNTHPELPASTLADSCYMSMFENCTKLSNVSNLSALTLANSCYEKMYKGCSSLLGGGQSLGNDPSGFYYQLPASTLATNCYKEMFMNCSSLTLAPVLPARELVSGCYSGIFANCSNIKRLKMLGEYYNGSAGVVTINKQVAKAAPPTTSELYTYYLDAAYEDIFGNTWFQGATYPANSGLFNLGDYTLIISNNCDSVPLYGWATWQSWWGNEYGDTMSMVPRQSFVFAYLVPSRYPNGGEYPGFGNYASYGYYGYGAVMGNSTSSGPRNNAWIAAGEELNWDDFYGSSYMYTRWRVITENGIVKRDYDFSSQEPPPEEV